MRQFAHTALQVHTMAGGISHLPLVVQEQPVGSFVLHGVRWGRLSAQRIRTAYTLLVLTAPLLHLTALHAQEQHQAILEERRLLASEIHDSLAQYFAGVLLQLSVAQSIAPQQPDEAWQLIGQAVEIARTAAHEARQSIWALQPPTDEYRDLTATLTQMVARQTLGTEVRAEVHTRGDPYPVSSHVGMNLLRIAQEALTNALHHARAAHLRVEIVYEARRLQVSVQDDGRGFDRSDPRFAVGFGLPGMQQRAGHIGATLHIDSQPGHGATVVVTLDTTVAHTEPETP